MCLPIPASAAFCIGIAACLNSIVTALQILTRQHTSDIVSDRARRRYFRECTVKVFMLGWEFPPLISGGLGVACYGLAKALNSMGTDVLFVLPKPLAPEGKKPASLASAVKAS